MTVSPAYNRDYRSANAAVADWLDGKDFVIEDAVGGNTGRYVSIRDGVPDVWIRYDRKRKKVKAPGPLEGSVPEECEHGEIEDCPECAGEGGGR